MPPSTESPTTATDAAQPAANTEPFSWLRDIVQKYPEKYFFQEQTMGEDIIVIHPAFPSGDRSRRVTRQGEIAVVADNSQWEFIVRPQMS